MRSTCRHSAVSGVRSSCEIIPRKRVLSWLVRWASSRAAVAAASRRLGARHRGDVLERLNDEREPLPSAPPAWSSRSTDGARRRRQQDRLATGRRPPISTDITSGASDDSARSRAPRRRAASVRRPGAAGRGEELAQVAPQHLVFGRARSRAGTRRSRPAAVSSGTPAARHGVRVASKSALKSGADRSPFLRSRKAHLSHPPPSDCRFTFLQTRP